LCKAKIIAGTWFEKKQKPEETISRSTRNPPKSGYPYSQAERNGENVFLIDTRLYQVQTLV
jgi:hypothetical protein